MRTQIFDESLHEMPYLRQTARCSEEIRDMQNLLQGVGLQGRDSRSKKGKLVDANQKIKEE